MQVDDERLYEAYRSELARDRLVRSNRAAGAVVIILNSAFIILDWLAYPELFERFFVLRMVLNLILGVLLLRFVKQRPVFSSIAGCLAIGGALLAVIEGAGGLMGEYYVGLVLLFVGMPVFMPYSAKQASFLVGILLAALAGLPFLHGTVEWRTYLLHLFFPTAAAVECVASCAVLDRARFRDFLRRRELEQARDHLKALDQEKSRFTANVHHELRTPLTLMLAPVESLLGGDFGELGGPQREYLQTVHTNGLRLLKLINNLLDLAKIEGAQLRIQRVPIRLGEVLRGLVASARPLAERKGVELSAEGLAGDREIHVDPDALEKILVNLLGNALKFTPERGRIEVRLAPAENGGAQLSVADSGIGIPSEQLDRIFDRFAQVDSSGTRNHEGTGIGLSLVWELVQLHGGRVWAESGGAGQGAQFHVLLPAGEPDAPEAEEALQDPSVRMVSLGHSMAAMEGELDLDVHAGRSGEAPSLIEMERSVERARFEEAHAEEMPEDERDRGARQEVLVVEDNGDMRKLLAHIVGKEYRVRTARNGREGLEAVRDSAPALVLTDVMMPEMSGTELCRILKNDPATRSIPVVLVTSKAEREMKLQGLELGADDYVTKPFHSRELMARLRSLLRLRSLQAQVARRNQELELANQDLETALAELKSAQSQLVQSERLAAVGELAAGVAHEVNNPVNFATNALKTLRAQVGELRRVAESLAALDPVAVRETQGLQDLVKAVEAAGVDELSDSLAELVAIATEGLERTHRLVADLRDFAAPGESVRREVDLARGIESTLQLVRHEMRQAGVAAELSIDPQLPAVQGDSRALNQVFLNLLKNATEALEGRGGFIQIGLRSAGDGVRIEVRDDGPGIPPEVQARLFEPFFTTKSAGRGTGLGLSISRRIIDEHGGRIQVESEPGEGTSFVIELPAQEGRGAA